MRTKRRYAHELYPHAGEYELRQGYYRASKLRKGTHLRLPWVRKPEPPPPVVLSLPRPGDPF